MAASIPGQGRYRPSPTRKMSTPARDPIHDRPPTDLPRSEPRPEGPRGTHRASNGTTTSSRSSSSTSACRPSRRTSIPTGRSTATSRPRSSRRTRWVAQQGVQGLTLEVVRLAGRTPVLFFDIPATGGRDASATVLLYGHLDKQPEMTGWREGLGPVDPGDRGRQALRPRRRRRRLRGLRRALGDHGARRAGRRAPALRGPHRDLRGERQLRPARVPRGARAAHGRCGARDRARLRRRQLRPALGDDVAARPGERHARRSHPRPRACTRATRAASCPRRSASRAACSIASTIRAPAW